MKTRDRTMIMVIGLFVMVAAFWFVVLSPKRESVATLRDDVAAAQTRLDSANAGAQSAAAAKATYIADYNAVANLGKAVPADDDVPSLVYQMQVASKQSGIEFDSIKLTGSSTPAAAPAAAPPTAQAGQLAQEQKGGAPGATPAPAAGSTTPPTTGPAGAAPPAPGAAVPAAQTAFAGLPPGATVGPAGLPTMPFDFEFSGPFLRLERLLKRIDAFTSTSGGKINVNGRLMTIDSISLAGFPEMKATIHATAFLVPDTQGLLNGATPAGPGTAAPAAGSPAPAGAAPVVPVATATPAAGVTK